MKKLQIALYYINKHTTNQYEFIGYFDTVEQMWDNIYEFFNKCKFQCYYTRNWMDDEGYTYIDFGSHFQFYRYKEVESEMK